VKRAESSVNRDKREKVEMEALERVGREEREKRKKGKAGWWMKSGKRLSFLLFSLPIDADQITSPHIQPRKKSC
jgi:hypothetical protein